MKELLSKVHLDINDLPSGCIVIGDDLIISTSTAADVRPHEPIKLDMAAITLCTSGLHKIKINLQELEIESSMLTTLMPGQIVESITCSVNYKAYSIFLSKRFIDMVNIPGWQQTYLSIYNNPSIHLDESQLRAFNTFFSVLHHAAEDESNPFRLQVIENLIRVFYYGGVNKLSPSQHSVATKNSTVERFMELVRNNYRTERLIGFYADKLCITPKYLSKLVKEHTGRSASDWIENHVILEARAMLQSSNMTIQQIANSLNFPNQSFFGKYFKRATGISPKQYRNNK